jgi:hypothetical protein
MSSSIAYSHISDESLNGTCGRTTENAEGGPDHMTTSSLSGVAGTAATGYYPSLIECANTFQQLPSSPIRWLN